MPGLDTNVVVHRSLLKLDCNLKQKLEERNLNELANIIKQYNVGFLEIVDYQDWSACIIQIGKSEVCRLSRY